MNGLPESIDTIQRISIIPYCNQRRNEYLLIFSGIRAILEFVNAVNAGWPRGLSLLFSKYISNPIVNGDNQ